MIIGDNASLEVVGTSSSAGDFVLRAQNNIFARDRVSLLTAGALSGAGARSDIETLVDNARVEIGDNATLESVGDIEISAHGTGDVFIQVNADTYGLGTVAGRSRKCRLAAT